MPCKVYRGVRVDGVCAVSVEDGGLLDGPRPLAPRHDLRNHSPDGYNWGYGGSGPAQLALAICCDVLGDDERAQRVYQTFKLRVIARLSADTWAITQRQAIEVIEAIEWERSRSPEQDGDQ